MKQEDEWIKFGRVLIKKTSITTARRERGYTILGTPDNWLVVIDHGDGHREKETFPHEDTAEARLNEILNWLNGG